MLKDWYPETFIFKKAGMGLIVNFYLFVFGVYEQDIYGVSLEYVRWAFTVGKTELPQAVKDYLQFEKKNIASVSKKEKKEKIKFAIQSTASSLSESSYLKKFVLYVNMVFRGFPISDFFVKSKTTLDYDKVSLSLSDQEASHIDREKYLSIKTINGKDVIEVLRSDWWFSWFNIDKKSTAKVKVVSKKLTIDAERKVLSTTQENKDTSTLKDKGFKLFYLLLDFFSIRVPLYISSYFSLFLFRGYVKSIVVTSSSLFSIYIVSTLRVGMMQVFSSIASIFSSEIISVMTLALCFVGIQFLWGMLNDYTFGKFRKYSFYRVTSSFKKYLFICSVFVVPGLLVNFMSLSMYRYSAAIGLLTLGSLLNNISGQQVYENEYVSTALMVFGSFFAAAELVNQFPTLLASVSVLNLSLIVLGFTYSAVVSYKDSIKDLVRHGKAYNFLSKNLSGSEFLAKYLKTKTNYSIKFKKFLVSWIRILPTATALLLFLVLPYSLTCHVFYLANEISRKICSAIDDCLQSRYEEFEKELEKAISAGKDEEFCSNIMMKYNFNLLNSSEYGVSFRLRDFIIVLPRNLLFFIIDEYTKESIKTYMSRPFIKFFSVDFKLSAEKLVSNASVISNIIIGGIFSFSLGAEAGHAGQHISANISEWFYALFGIKVYENDSENESITSKGKSVLPPPYPIISSATVITSYSESTSCGDSSEDEYLTKPRYS